MDGYLTIQQKFGEDFCRPVNDQSRYILMVGQRAHVISMYVLHVE